MNDVARAAPAAPPTKLFLAVPGDWIHLDMGKDALKSSRRLVDRMTEGSPENRKLKIQFAAALQSSVRKAREQGGVLAAFWSRTLDGRSAGASVIAAVTRLERGVLDPDGTVNLDRAVRAVTSAVAGGGGDSDGKATIVESDTVELPAGPAVRVRKTQAVDALGQRHHTEVVQYFVPVPDQLALGVLTFSTPTVEIADALVELFDAMAYSLRWRTGAEPEAATSSPAGTESA